MVPEKASVCNLNVLDTFDNVLCTFLYTDAAIICQVAGTCLLLGNALVLMEAAIHVGTHLQNANVYTVH